MSYKILDHATDAIVEVRADDLDTAFSVAGTAAAEIMLDTTLVSEVHTWQIKATGDDLRHLLYDWLEAVIYSVITDGSAISRITARVRPGTPSEVTGMAYGENLDLRRHGFKVEIKAPTFHEMEIDESDGVRLRFLLDL